MVQGPKLVPGSLLTLTATLTLREQAAARSRRRKGLSGCIDPGAFVAKLGLEGEKKFAMCISGLGQDTGLDIAIDPSGCAYVTGFTESNNYPTVNAFQPFFAGGTGATPSDAFVTKLCSGPDHFKCYDVTGRGIFPALPRHSDRPV